MAHYYTYLYEFNNERPSQSDLTLNKTSQSIFVDLTYFVKIKEIKTKKAGYEDQLATDTTMVNVTLRHVSIKQWLETHSDELMERNAVNLIVLTHCNGRKWPAPMQTATLKDH